MCAWILVSTAAPANAQSGNHRFQQYVSQGAQAYQNGDSDGAVRALVHAYDLRAVPVLLFNIGRAYELGGHLASAIEYYDRFLVTSPEAGAAQTARETREAARVALAAREPPSADTATPRAAGATPHPANQVDEGRHFGAVHAVLIGGGAAGLIAGGVLGVLALNSSTQFQATMDPTQRAGLQDGGTRFALGADIALGVGIVAVAAGFIAYLLQDTRSTPRNAATGRSAPMP